ncbi:putative major intrinsic protein [Dioscorea sansibarensis]
MGPIKAAVYDALIMFLWMFCVSTVSVFTSLIATAINVQGFAPNVLITIGLIASLIFVFNIICDALGGASFNPTGTAAFYASGYGGGSLLSMALRFPAQALGAAGGVLAIMEFMPPQYKHMLGGPSLKVDAHTGAIAEGLLTFLITFTVLWVVTKGPRNSVIQAWLLAACTVTFVIAGTGYTGPSMNPANAFGWAYIHNRHNTWEHFYVYWISPFIGAIMASWLFRIIFPPPAAKVKKA